MHRRASIQHVHPGSACWCVISPCTLRQVHISNFRIATLRLLLMQVRPDARVVGLFLTTSLGSVTSYEFMRYHMKHAGAPSKLYLDCCPYHYWYNFTSAACNYAGFPIFFLSNGTHLASGLPYYVINVQTTWLHLLLDVRLFRLRQCSTTHLCTIHVPALPPAKVKVDPPPHLLHFVVADRIMRTTTLKPMHIPEQTVFKYILPYHTITILQVSNPNLPSPYISSLLSHTN